MSEFAKTMRAHTANWPTRRRESRKVASLIRELDRASEASLRRGMHYPTRWDPFFKDHMTLADIFHYPTQHFDFHLKQLSLKPPQPD